MDIYGMHIECQVYSMNMVLEIDFIFAPGELMSSCLVRER